VSGGCKIYLRSDLFLANDLFLVNLLKSLSIYIRIEHELCFLQRALNLTEVLKVREAQVANNKNKRNLEVQRNIAWKNEIRKNYLDSLDSENQANKLRKEKFQHTFDYQQAQYDKNNICKKLFEIIVCYNK